MLSIVNPRDNGNIRVLRAQDPSDIHLEIREDSHNSKFFQWFNFKLQGEIGLHHVLHIDNASTVSFQGWNTYEPYKAYASYGNDEWFNIDTEYNEATGMLKMELDLAKKDVQIAFFPPFDYARHLDLIRYAEQITHCSVSALGKTNEEDGRDITLLTFGDGAAEKKKIWIIARQHPGEPQAEWYAKGLIEHLAAHPELLESYTFYIVPNMNPDGTYLGNLRTNKKGKDLNRMWQNPTVEESPEVYYTFKKMEETGVDFFIDTHSDERIPGPFLDESHLSCPLSNEILEHQEALFMWLYINNNQTKGKSNPMQNEINYGAKDRTDPVNMTLAAMSIGSRFNCPAFTLEMPTKSWNWLQCESLAVDFFEVLQKFYDKLNELRLKAPGINSFMAKVPGKDNAKPVSESEHTVSSDSMLTI